jgi:hypothetical protein
LANNCASETSDEENENIPEDEDGDKNSRRNINIAVSKKDSFPVSSKIKGKKGFNNFEKD